MAFTTQPPFALAHMTYFKLADRSPKTLEKFLELCEKYLSGHVGQTEFSLGLRAVEMQRDVNARDFDVAMNMVFESLASYNLYLRDARHDAFITAAAGMSSARKVYDSYLQPITKKKTASSKTSAA
jgi:hypothetical protein